LGGYAGATQRASILAMTSRILLTTVAAPASSAAATTGAGSVAQGSPSAADR
jgi:hypothetical protein